MAEKLKASRSWLRIRFLLDEHVSNAVAQGLRRREVELLTSSEAGLLGQPDEAYLIRSQRDGLVVVTHDSDFLALSTRTCARRHCLLFARHSFDRRNCEQPNADPRGLGRTRNQRHGAIPMTGSH